MNEPFHEEPTISFLYLFGLSDKVLPFFLLPFKKIIFIIIFFLSRVTSVLTSTVLSGSLSIAWEQADRILVWCQCKSNRKVRMTWTICLRRCASMTPRPNDASQSSDTFSNRRGWRIVRLELSVSQHVKYDLWTALALTDWPIWGKGL